MPNSQNPSSPNFVPGVGRLVTDRFDFQSHVDGTAFNHTASKINLSPHVVVDSNTVINVQDAIVALNNFVNTFSTSLATDSTPGLVQLSTSGDVQGTATQMRVVNIRGIPVSPVVPTTGQVLAYSGSAWEPTTTATFTASGDLTGNSTSQTVTALTGSGGVVNMHGNFLLWDAASTVAIEQLRAVSGDGGNFTIVAQSGAPTTGNGGEVRIVGGNVDTGNILGGVQLMLGDGSIMVHPTQVITTKRVLSLLDGTSAITSSNMPANTGDMVMFVKDASTDPTSGVPSGGTILYSSGGKLKVKQSSGRQFIVGPDINPTQAGVVGSPYNSVTIPTIGTEQEFHFRASYQTTTNSTQTLSLVIPNNTTATITALFIGKQSGAGNALARHDQIYMGYVSNGSGVMTAVGANTVGSRTAGLASGWTASTITTTGTGGNINFNTGFQTATTINWTISIDMVLTLG